MNANYIPLKQCTLVLFAFAWIVKKTRTKIHICATDLLLISSVIEAVDRSKFLLTSSSVTLYSVQTIIVSFYNRTTFKKKTGNNCVPFIPLIEKIA